MRTALALTLDDAKAIAAAARTEAHMRGWKVAIAVVDGGGHVLYLERDEAAQAAGSEVAIRKAATAVLFRRPTKAIEDAVTAGRMVLMHLPGATPIEGGIPLVRDGEFLGAIGVSGLQSFEDAIVAAAGAAALGRLEIVL
jgi:glc operon protein GlcG